jgi:hypothetical protein
VSTIHLTAVDEKRTICAEDGFSLEVNGSHKKLTVASVIPSQDLRFNKVYFVRNLYRRSEDGPEIFLSRSDRLLHGLHPLRPVNVLMTIFELNDQKFEVSIGTGIATATLTSYEDFSSDHKFEKTKQAIEEFLFQNYHIYWKYSSGHGQDSWQTEKTPGRRIISGMMSLFNYTVSNYAYKTRIKTLKRTNPDLQLKVHNEAKFGGPLRRAVSFINIINFAATLEGREVPFSLERLQSIVGEGYPIKT